MSIIVEGISKYYGSQKVLDDVSLQVEKGEVSALLGPNGAGKTTLMKILTCYIPQTSGKVSVCGFDVESQSMEVRRKVGYLPETNPLYLDMYVREYLQLMASIHKLGKNGKARVKEMIELTGLTREAHKVIGTLSKGYRQRVGLAQALLHDPEVLILDEPTSGLDPNQIVEIRNLVKNIGKEKTVLLSTHVMQEVEAICDKVIIINLGKIVADAPTNQVQLLTQTTKIIKVEFDKPVSIDDIKKIDGVVDIVSTKARIFKVFSQGDVDLRPAIFNFAVENGLVIMMLDIEEKSLEEVFRQLTVYPPTP